MNCPVCKRDLAPTLSICPSCGTMMNDSVREELETKVVSASNSGRLKSINIVATPPPAPPVITVAVQPQPEHPGNTVSVQPQPVSTVPVQTRPAAAMAVQPPKPVRAKVQTSELFTKKTSPTLVGFQPKAAAVPAWRLQLQN